MSKKDFKTPVKSAAVGSALTSSAAEVPNDPVMQSLIAAINGLALDDATRYEKSLYEYIEAKKGEFDKKSFSDLRCVLDPDEIRALQLVGVTGKVTARFYEALYGWSETVTVYKKNNTKRNKFHWIKDHFGAGTEVCLADVLGPEHHCTRGGQCLPPRGRPRLRVIKLTVVSCPVCKKGFLFTDMDGRVYCTNVDCAYNASEAEHLKQYPTDSL